MYSSANQLVLAYFTPFQDIFDGTIGPNFLIGSEHVESFLQWDNLSMILWGYRLQSNSSEGSPYKFCH